MNPDQLAVVTSPAPWNIVLAGPGSGKSRVIVERAKALKESGVNPADMAFVTFTNIGAKVMRRRLAEAVGHVGYVGTLHGMMMQLLRRDDPRWVLIGEDDAAEFLARHAKVMGYKGTDAELQAARSLDEFSDFMSPALRAVRAYRLFMRSEKMLDFDMVLREGLRCIESLRFENPWTHWFVDEFQDSGPEDAKIYLSANPTQLLVVGDPDQCQPAGTMVRLADGVSEKPIEDLRVGEQITTYARREKTFLKCGVVRAVSRRSYSGSMITVTAAGKSTDCTPNHRWLIKWLSGKGRNVDTWCTYIMRKGDHFRVGKTMFFRSDGSSVKAVIGLGLRMRQEGADSAWVLKTHETEAEATAHEQIVAANFGLPEACFKAAKNCRHFTQSVIDSIFANIHDQKARARLCLEAHGRLLEFPLFDKDEPRTRRTVQEIRACNLIDGVMHVPICPDRLDRNNRGGAWAPITVTSRQYSGYVWSLDIAKYHKYVANGIGTCNSIFGFRGARPANVTDYWNDKRFARHVMGLNYRCASRICDVANSVIAANAGRIAKDTISAVELEGEVNSQACPTDAAERMEVVSLAKQRIAGGVAPHEVAVLCRTNRLANELRDAVREAGVPVADVEPERKPKDWPLLLQMLSLIATPSSWAMARLFARLQAKHLKEDQAVAEHFVMCQRDQGHHPTAQWSFPSPGVILSLNADLSRYGISKASHALMAERIRLYRPDSIEELIAALRESPETKSTRGVNVLTVHAAKGEEWDAVIVAGTEMFHSADAAGFNEERRLLFVAITRARKYLNLTSASERRISLPNGQIIMRQAPTETICIPEICKNP